ncbi:hypothetical protein LCGC14_1109290 [marine sediment metagenome]|uniref:Putative exodeoxyribonuclease 8 PDDEXK-like domain-containing protein n=1 Tax=marine sediment metagenome TaxID=412755 RepID=A0A0F9QDF5_9ZZZZ
MTESEYNAIDAIRHSRLKVAGVSMKHYKHALDNERADKPHFKFGRAVHCAVLEPLAFTSRYVLWDGGRRAGKTWTAFVEATPGHDILTATEWNDCMAMVEAVRSHPLAASILSKGEPEVTLTWQDKETGLCLKCRCDWARPGIVVDLKTATEGDFRDFSRAVAKYGYASQAAFYSDGYAAVHGKTPHFVFIVVEKSAPFDCVVYELDDEAIASGRRSYRGLLEQVAACERFGRWPGRSDELETLRLPSWAL